MKKIYFSSYNNYQFDNELNITNEELNVLKSLAKRDDIIIQKAGKGNSVVILNKCDYTKRMNETLSDPLVRMPINAALVSAFLKYILEKSRQREIDLEDEEDAGALRGHFFKYAQVHMI